MLLKAGGFKVEYGMHMYLRNELIFWSVHGIMNTSDLLQS